ncbi:TRAP transporter large permease [Oceanispirochaeta crateris]|uniref:TRAP transporter large permease n=1 Tax=Oceanispirochaeta crateris TaxID=2518645 RepID=A0A5C1QJF3_9SPIO|nr:TRAP transporter large permease [Oceanispirochaeta crateris]QEN06724.1 TRAP transporter large permease [Oceanispirochaeta crateris]
MSPILIPIFVLIIVFVLRIPIAIGMVSASVSYFLYVGQDLSMVTSKVLDVFYSQYTIMAVPLFIFTARIMNSGKVTNIIFEFANGLVGRFRGGTGHVNVIASIIFSGMTGSAIADASGLGLMEIESMKDEGYDADFSCAVTAASATIGPVFPPSIPMIVYSMLSGASIGALFLGGMIPGLMIGVALMIYIAFIATKRNYPYGVKKSLREFCKFSVMATPALLTPVILLGGIYTGVITPTEAGALASAYAIIISVFVYKVLGFNELKQVILDTAKSTGIVGIIVGSAATFSYIVAIEHIPEIFGNILLGVTTNKYILLLIINGIFLLLGMFIDTSIITLVFIPMILPLVTELGIDLVHFGVMITLNMMIGLSTPPFGMLLFIVSGVSKTPLEGIIKEVIPMVFVMIIVLFLVTFIPEIVLILPRLLM